jgi:2-dehydropantoate 2-reductase
MNAVIAGAGALGRLLGAYLAKGEAGVTLLDLRRDRPVEDLDVEVRTIDGGGFRRPVRLAHRLKDVPHADLLIVAVKTFQSRETLPGLVAFRERVNAFVSFQNGLEKDRLLQEYFGQEKVIGGCCAEGATLLENGAIMHTMSLGTYFGEHDGTSSARVEAAACLFTQAGLKAEARTDVVSATWAKWIHFASGASGCGLTRLPYHKVLLHPAGAALNAQIHREFAALAEACGVELHDYPGFEVRTIIEATPEQAVALLQQRGRRLQNAGAVKVMPSLAQSLCAGRPTETEAIFGFAVREAAARGVAMPLTGYVYDVFRTVDESRDVP